jgi:hypothetical protein
VALTEQSCLLNSKYIGIKRKMVRLTVGLKGCGANHIWSDQSGCEFLPKVAARVDLTRHAPRGSCVDLGERVEVDPRRCCLGG